MRRAGLLAVRAGLPAAMVAAGVLLIVLGGEISDGAGVFLIGAASLVAAVQPLHAARPAQRRRPRARGGGPPALRRARALARRAAAALAGVALGGAREAAEHDADHRPVGRAQQRLQRPRRGRARSRPRSRPARGCTRWTSTMSGPTRHAHERPGVLAMIRAGTGTTPSRRAAPWAPVADLGRAEPPGAADVRRPLGPAGGLGDQRPGGLRRRRAGNGEGWHSGRTYPLAARLPRHGLG